MKLILVVFSNTCRHEDPDIIVIVKLMSTLKKMSQTGLLQTNSNSFHFYILFCGHLVDTWMFIIIPPWTECSTSSSGSPYFSVVELTHPFQNSPVVVC